MNAWTRWTSAVRRRPLRPDRHAGPIEVTLLGRPGCHLCDEAASILANIGRKLPLNVRYVDIESDDTLLARYMIEIPVILADGVEVARAPIRRRALEAVLGHIAATTAGHSR